MKHDLSLFLRGCARGAAASVAALAVGACTVAEPTLDVVSEQRALTQSVELFGYRTDTGNELDWWLDTGISVSAGSAVGTSCVAGRNLPWGFGPQLDCAGDTSQPPWSESIADGCRFGSLVGKIGSSGTPFCLGDTPSITASASGTLYLGFNDGVSFEDNQGSWDIQVDVTDPTASGWSVSAHPAGPSWVWNQDPALRVVLADDNGDDPWGRGLYFIYGSEVHGSLASNYYVIDDTCGTRWAPLILVTPRDSNPLISAANDLELEITGSHEHDCDDLGYDEATAIVSAQATSSGIDITAVIDGVAYFSLPPDGTVEVQHTGGPSFHDAADLVAGGSNVGEEHNGVAVTEVTSTGSALGTITLEVSPSLPRLQLVGGPVCPGGSPPSGFVEVDSDHSCEVSGFQRPTFTLSTHIPR